MIILLSLLCIAVLRHSVFPLLRLSLQWMLRAANLAQSFDDLITDFDTLIKFFLLLIALRKLNHCTDAVGVVLTYFQ